MRSGPPARARYALLWALATAGWLAASAAEGEADAAAKPIEAVIAAANGVDGDKVAAWKREGFRAVVVVLEERAEARALQKAARAVAANSLDLYYWIEVGRNPDLAERHPEWMAPLGMHDDWRKRFPKVRPTTKGEVAKAWPWVPISYRESFDAHRKRIKRLLATAPEGYRGLLLNDLQGGPASCGCGNLQCRWAVDYGVPSTATKLAGPDVAARFVAEVGKAVTGKEVIPVWTTECEQEDLPAGQRPKRGWGTGYCGNVPCFDTCRKRFAEQWKALNASRRGPTAVLLLHREFHRDLKGYGGPAGWITQAVASLAQRGTATIPPRRLWLVVQGYGVPAEEEAAARRLAAKTGAGLVLVARTPIDQSYEPRITKVK